MVGRVVVEQDRPRLHDVDLVLDQPFVGRLAGLALGSVVVEEPVATKGVRVLFTCQADDLGRLGLEPVESARTHLGRAMTST